MLHPTLNNDGARTDGARIPARALVPAPVYSPPAPVMGGYAPRGPEILYGGFNQTWMANCLRRRWLMAVLMGLLVGAASTGLLLWLFPSMSQVTAYLKVKSRPDEIFSDTKSQRYISPQEIQRQAMNHITLLKSPMVLTAALMNPDIAQLDAVRNNRHREGEDLLWLMDELKVSFPGDGEILEVKYDGEEDAEQMRRIVDEVVKAYQNKVLFQDKTVAASTQHDLAIVLEQTKTQLQKNLDKLKQSMTAKGVAQEEVEIPRLQREVAQLEGLIVAEKQKLVDLEVLKNLAMQDAQSPAALDAMVRMELDKDPFVVNYQQQIAAAMQSLQARQGSTKNRADATIKRLQGQIQQLQSAMDDYKASQEKQLRDKYKRMPNDQLTHAIVEYKLRYKASSDNLKEFESKLEADNTKLLALGVADPEIEMLKQEVENETDLVKSLEQKIMEWDVLQKARDKQAGQASDLETVSVIQEATGLPDTNTVERLAIAGVGGSAAFALTCYGIALLEFRKRRLNGPTDMDEGLGIRVLGVLPSTTLKGMAGNSLTATQVAEAIDNVRATLMHDSTNAPRQVVMITSSGSQEGTTIVASSLALSLSRAGRRTLLVDADLRTPALHRLFGMPMEEGLSEVLRAEIDLADAIKPTNNPGLYLLTAGVCSAEAIHSLATDQPQAIFEKLRDQFDFVVIDAPPVLGISDALSIGQYADGAILTVLRDHSEIYKVHKAVEMLRHMGVRLVGAVVNGVPVKADRRVVRLHQSQMQAMPRLTAVES
jgi:capsular exopolysaccharide synthesis family protein